MNIIKNSVLLPGITLILLSGCANVQNNPLYMPQQGYISQAIPVSAPASPAEQQYVAHYYGL